MDDLEVQDFNPYIFIQLSRIYDLLAIIARQVDKAGAEEILQLHEEGKLFGAPPSLTIED